jgi:parvulin-like peptidyl-prolyl isomerase
MLVTRLVLPFCAAALAWSADVQLVDEIVAKVNGDIITRNEVDKTRRAMAEELKARGAKPAEIDKLLEDRQKDFLRDRIDQLLLVQKGKELNINVDQELSKIFADMMRQNKIADQDKFQSYIREQTGMPFEDFKNEYKNSLLTQRVIGQEVQSRVSIPKAEARKFYDENQKLFQREERVFLREILVSTEGKTGPALEAAEKKAKDLVARARKGEKFPELARDNSDSQSAAQGGDIGAFKRGELNPAIDKLVWENNRGFVTDPLKVGNGWLIIRVEEKHKAGLASFEEVEQEVTGRIYNQKMNPAVREYLTRLRYEAFLEIKDGYLDSGAAPGKSTKWTDPAILKPETISKEEIARQTRKKRFLGIPIPGTSTSVVKEEAAKEEPKGESKSKPVKALS